MKVPALVAVLALLLNAPTLADDQSRLHRPIEMRVSPLICFSPCSVRIIIRIEPHESNRFWTVRIDGEMSSSTERQLEGIDSPATQDAFWFKGLGPGEYALTATVYSSTATRGSVVQRVIVS